MTIQLIALNPYYDRTHIYFYEFRDEGFLFHLDAKIMVERFSFWVNLSSKRSQHT